MPDNRPQGRERKITGQSAGVHRRSEGLGTGPVGSGSNPKGQRPGGGQRGYQSSGTRAGGRSPLIIIILIAVLLFGGGGGLGSVLGLFGGGSTDSYAGSQTGTGAYDSLLPGSSGQSGQSGQSSTGTGSLANLLLGGGNSWTGGGSSSGSWTGSVNTGKLDRSVSPEAREKYTRIVGGGADQVTVMVYMCGTDLESRSAMASRDLQEMAQATLSDRLNLVICTGGCSRWQTQGISNRVNQIFELRDGYLRDTGTTAGSGAMTDPNTLLSFIRYATDNYPANRYELILWDHGGGSISGYGYDEKFQTSGSMSLASLAQALKAGGVKYDFIGFDACLMATAENAVMLADYADYMIASEETEPGVGWYYTNWLTALAADTSLPTLDVGQKIVDDFVSFCNQKCPGQPTTLSVVDLAELGETLPADLKAFSADLKDRITGSEYKTVSAARGNTKEFASSTKIDQIDFIDFAERVGSSEGEALAQTLRSAVKYNRTGGSVSNAYGLSVYFPLKKLSTVDKAVRAYDAMGMDEAYSDCIRAFASLEAGGQISAGGSASNPYASLLGNYGASSASAGSSGDISDLLGAAMSGDLSSLLGIGSSGFFSGRSMPDVESAAAYLAANRFNPDLLFWQRNADGDYVISLDEVQWSLVQDVAMNLFVDDGEGYVDLGLDNVFSFDENGNLLPDRSGAWLALDGQTVAYYFMCSGENEDGAYTMGYVPALLNGEQVRLILIFPANADAYVAGAQPAYAAGETDTLARGLIELQDGDRLDFLCDFYSYAGEYQDSYLLGEPMTVSGAISVSDMTLDESLCVLYRFTDIYQQHYWSEVLPG
ncbi:MAG: peptidase C11 [Oscillospiraceae bacterium]|nr:peptidase C11 [Oscillospiraceae bacterium]